MKVDVTAILVTVCIGVLIWVVLLPLIISSNKRIEAEEAYEKSITHYIELPSGQRVVVKVIDGCEYILFDRGIAHKGNCTNVIHGGI